MSRLVFLALAVIAAALFIGGRGTGPVSADQPHAGVSFSIGISTDGDGDNDCGTGAPMGVGNGAPDPVSVQVSNTTCEVREGGGFRVNVYVMGNGGVPEAAMSATLNFTGVTSAGVGDSVWEGCTFEATASNPGFENTGCVIGLPPATPPQHVGLISTFPFSCAADGTITLNHENGNTAITDETLVEHREAGPDVLTIDCVEGLPETNGDSDCNGTVNSIDAALILQNTAGLLANIPCPGGADANDNGTVDSIDAALVLQFSAGLLDEL
jgi:hypothetical protein